MDAAHLWIFFGLVFSIVILPGMDMAFVLGSALVGGRRAGLAAVAGLIAGGICHVTVGALGLKQPLRSPTGTFSRAMMTNLLNPKAYVFMLAVFPQFIRPDRPVAGQAVVLSAIITVTQGAVYGAVALAADRLRGWLIANPRANRRLARTVGALLVLMAVFTVVEGWRR